ncbi:MAG: hypothetical protein GQ538_12265 [Xanthomonadales bacterium]|nr:hypothetical protein [Xanthomonadales bacterium]
MHDKILLITAAFYLAAVIFLYLAVAENSSGKRTLAAVITLLGVFLHSWAETQHWIIPATPQISVLNVLSLCALVIVAIPLGTFPLRNNLFDASLIALPLSVLVLVAEGTIAAPVLEISRGPMGITVHIITSILAFGVLSIAGVYATFVYLIDYLLRHHRLNKLVQTLPALDTLEELLFHLIKAGFAVLTVSLLTGLIFVNDLFGQHLAHKTLLSIFAWLVFAVLLWGRWKKGWRGRVAVRMTLAGIVLLLLSYFGSKLILEVFLQRSWLS